MQGIERAGLEEQANSFNRERRCASLMGRCERRERYINIYVLKQVRCSKKKERERLDVKNLTNLNELREKEKKTLGSCKDSKRVMAGGRCASSSCQSRGRTTEGGDGEKLSSVHLNTPLSAKKE